MTLTRRDLVVRRRLLGVTKRQLAEKAGIDPSNLSKIERGKRPLGWLMQQTLDYALRCLEAERADDQA